MDRSRPWQAFCRDQCRFDFHNEKRRQIKNPPNTSTRSIRKGSKIAAVLAELARGARLTRFDAERVCHDHTLPSTVSEIQRLSIRVERETVTVPGHGNRPTRCARYWLDDAERERAATLLGGRDGEGQRSASP